MKELILFMILLFSVPNTLFAQTAIDHSPQKRLAYIVSDIRIPFWEIMGRGIVSKAESLGYRVTVYSADNLRKQELKNVIDALKSNVDGIILSPISSSTAATILKLASKAKVPVVISDIGTDSGEYVSYISSDNIAGAYNLGQILAQKMQQLQWDKGSVGIVAIPQKRINGQERTFGFMKAMQEAGIKGAGLRQQVDFSYKETYNHVRSMIHESPNLRAIWLQGSNRYQAALDAIEDSGKKGEILLVCFDAEPEFLELIPRENIIAAAMQQPFLMGEEAVNVMDKHLHGKPLFKEIKIPILAISADTIKNNLSNIKRNVLGTGEEK